MRAQILDFSKYKAQKEVEKQNSIASVSTIESGKYGLVDILSHEVPEQVEVHMFDGEALSSDDIEKLNGVFADLLEQLNGKK